MKKIIIYFSRAFENYAVGYIDRGNTEVIAQYIHEITKAPLFKVEPLVPYSKEYDHCVLEAKERIKTHNAPIKEMVPDLADYDVIYIGTPVYFGGMPEEMVTALSNQDFTGKIIKPFVTHEGSGFAKVPTQLKSICKSAQIENCLAIKGVDVEKSRHIVEEWV